MASPVGAWLVAHLVRRTSLLWFFLIVWTGFVVQQAWTELNSGTAVQGLHREYRPPFQHQLGWVVDPRSRPLLDEVGARYRSAGFEPGQVLPTGDWGPTLRRLGFTNVEVSGQPWKRRDPRLRMGSTPQSHHLLLGIFGVQYLLFYPEVGVVLADTLPSAVREWRLVDAVEAPW